MSRRGRVLAAAAVVAAGVAAGVVAAVLLAGDGASGTDPHALALRADAAGLADVLQAADTAAATTPPAELVAEGRALFRSTEDAKTGESCQSCHTEGGGANATVGTIVHPQASGDFTGPRDVSSLWGADSTPPYGWAGLTPGLQEFVVGTIRSHFTDGTTQPREETAREAAAIVAYLETLEPPASDFDRGTLSPAARRGEELFQGKGGCIDCHSGPLLTDNALHDTFVPRVADDDTDWGAARTGALRNAFNTPHLRDVRNTAPYMHNGSLATLRDVVVFYAERASTAPLDLTPDEVDDLVAYLEAL